MATTREMCAQRSAKRCTSWLRISHAPRTAIALVSSVLIWASPAFAQDSDLDGLSDADEIGVHGTNPALPDTDADGVGDYDEAIRFATDPLDDDSDDDGLLDGEESLTASGFALPVPIGLPAFPDAAGDVDGDGDLDLFTSYPWGGVYWVETLSGPPWASFGASSTLLDDPASRYGCSPAILVDADEDGDLDVVRSETISVAAPVYVAPALRTSENRLDEPSADFAAATHFTDVEVGHDVRFVDLDGDGRVDLWNHGKCGIDLDTTSWNARLAGAPGPFYFAENAPLAPVIDAFQYPAAKVFADFDGDGDPDLVWGGTSGPHPAVWWSENRLDEPSADFGTPEVVATFDASLTAVVGIDVQPMDDTPLPEVVVWGPGEEILLDVWVVGNPNETRPSSAVTLPFGPFEGDVAQEGGEPHVRFALADLDGDGDPDLATTQCIDDRGQRCSNSTLWPSFELVWVENRFDEPQAGWGKSHVVDDGVHLYPPWGHQTAAFDVDQDGDADLLEMTTYGPRYFENVRGLGTDPLSSDSDGDGLTDGDEVRVHGTSPTRADTDGDGLGDALELGPIGTDPNDPDSDDDGLLDGEEGATAQGLLAPPRLALGHDNGRDFDLAFSDFDGDGDLDVIGIGWTLYFFENRLGEPEDDFFDLQMSTTLNGGAILDPIPGPPAALVPLGATGHYPWVGFGNGSMGLPWGPWVSNGGSGSGKVHPVDFDGDGDTDALSYGPGPTLHYVENRLGEPSADLAAPVVLADLSSMGSFTDGQPADLDGDGDVDFLLVEQTTNAVWWFENRLDDVTADFSAAQVVASGGEHSGLVSAADIDGDGDLDPITTTFRYGDITWFENRLATGQPFVEHVAGATNIWYGRLTAGDLDADGLPEIVVSSSTLDFNAGPQRIRIYSGDGSAAPMSVELIDLGGNEGAGDVAVVDIDGDGDLDLVAANAADLFVIENLRNLATDPNDPDSDDDGFEDGFEVAQGSDPNDPTSVPELALVPLGSLGGTIVWVGLLVCTGLARLAHARRWRAGGAGFASIGK